MTTKPPPPEFDLEREAKELAEKWNKGYELNSLDIEYLGDDIKDFGIRALSAERAKAEGLVEAAEMLWIVIANVSGGDWTKQSQDWQEAAARWRDNYLKKMALYRKEKKG